MTATAAAETAEGPAPVTETNPVRYVVPAVSDLGTVTGATLGTAGFDRIDDTQYYDS
ncbi:hypothetical protein [Streptomyces malaysiensis]|uniref:Lasso RiPP family leader peptide-containing protein n=1 Tax=Streptomyces malaysiensis subsp. samsunensis TaxID=459658 RepID=A0A9X2RZ92_STRMQ|nr:hypothetical protein [Streptomyces samsunensis]MCQ8836187.1 hypothetical protein [Streptomyces samsunensis]